MDCIKDFLDDSYQAKLRKFAQGLSERHEDTIDSYRKLFITHYNYVKYGNEKCKECSLLKSCKQIRNKISDIEEKDIEDFFNCVKEIYLKWINSNPFDAINAFEDLLNKHNLLGYEKELSKEQIYFKARNSDKVLTRWDMFHIPFNKRYLIGNQRYSLTGQPMLYIGSSVIDVATEIDVKDINNLKVSVVRLPDNNFKIYDLRCSILDVYTEISFNNMTESEKRTYTSSDFFKMILASVCSFQKKSELKGYSFCEEYIIPQILALILKNNNYNGISYTSTKKYYEYIATKSDNYKENIAIFTKLDSEHVYDRELYDKINLTVPVDISKIDIITEDEIIDLLKEIEKLHSQEKITCSQKIYSSYKYISDEVSVGGKEYSDTDYGKIHLYELYTVLNNILVE